MPFGNYMPLSVGQLIKVLNLYRKDEIIHFTVAGHDNVNVESIHCNIPLDDLADQWLEIVLSVDDSEEKLISNG